MHTVAKLTSILGSRLPIIQAPMAGVQDSRLAAAVSNAGGLGSLPAAMLDTATLASELAALRAQTEAFNVNFFCHAPPERDSVREQQWLKALQGYYQEFDVAPPDAAGPGRNPFSAEIAEVLEANPPAVVSFHFGLPDESLLVRVQATGAAVISSATTVAEARWLEARGVSAIIAQGTEAGGHRGMFLDSDLNSQLGTFALLPQIVQAVGVPVIAAGGIADAAGVTAAMQLGASGVQVGTSFLLCEETATSSLHRAVLADVNGDTALTNVFSGRPARGICNRIMRELGPMSPLAPAFPLAGNALAPLRRAAEAIGSSDFTPLWSGQNRTGCAAIPAAEMLRRLAAGLPD